MEKNENNLICLPRIFDPRGNLTVAEAERHIPFPIRRAYWVKVEADMRTNNVANLSWR